ncbi:PAS domain-containing protein [Yoonia maricola]|uniref:PAS domain-containing protein n=1 Tax=Yoonia maricola TaxID=420999 RepID=A0A2M8WLU1_9RHOB|nr:PAS domain-containing protein [Yoonia maricola]PJI91904.1 PAS domain-containing protein [Yoonia maricola]
MDISDQSKERRQVQMPGHDDPILRHLEAYWQTLRNARQLPARTDIAPSKIDEALPHAFILQRVAPGMARFRVAGQRLHDLLKMDARGMPLGTLFQSGSREQAQQLIEAAFAGPAIVSIPLSSPGTLMRPALNGTMLLLPLRDRDNNSTRMLGALVTDQDGGARPRRFEIPQGARIRHEPIGVQLATAQLVPRAHAKGPDAARPALKLVVNNG